jgi:group II intron reverse transcriptase/maturase
MEKDISLDEQFLCKLKNSNVQQIFNDLAERKTDLLDGNIRLAKGIDGVDYTKFKNKIFSFTDTICLKGSSGKYIFSPFREITVPKPPYEKDQLDLAKAKGKTRTLSISTIQDTIFQILMSQVLVPFAEKKFSTYLDKNSFAYRKNKSSKMALQLIIKYISQGYQYVLDSDIEKFFDKIDHRLLNDKCQSFFGEENELLQKYIYRFMNVSRIPDGKLYEYKSSSGKSGIERRMVGIPQGGVLSGLLANVFLYDFDHYVTNDLSDKYDFKYVRYADDFVLLFKSPNYMEDIFENLNAYLDKEKLRLYPIGEKSNIVDLTKHKRQNLEFLGFSISPKYLRPKTSNIEKFYHRIKQIAEDIPADNTEGYLKQVSLKIRPKIIGLEDLLSENGYCTECNQLLQKRNWIGYFMIIDDVRLLRNMDTNIRRIIYRDYYKKTKRHLKKKEFQKTKDQMLSLEKTYYLYKKQERLIRSGKMSYCGCRRYFDQERDVIVVIPCKSECH